MISHTLSGRYKVVDVLGAGGMGRTYIAEDILRPGNPKCVVKQLQPASTDPNVLNIARRLFETEAEMLERLGYHDQIPRLLAYFEQDQEFYLVQEFIEGHPLSVELPQGQRWSEAQVLQFLQETLIVLSFIHEQNVIHRDIKPDNIIRRAQDKRPVLIDFGAVKQVRMQQPTIMGQASVTVAIGTPGYMPTEQSSGKPRPSSDVYALGMVAIQALTGVLPAYLHEDDDGEVVWRHLADVSDELAAILTKMVRHYFKHRYQSAAEVLEALHQLNTPTLAPLGSSSTEFPPTKIWHRQAWPDTPSTPPTPLSANGATLPRSTVQQPSAASPPSIPSTPPTYSASTPPQALSSSIPSVPPTQAVSPTLSGTPSVPPTQPLTAATPGQSHSHSSFPNGSSPTPLHSSPTPSPMRNLLGTQVVESSLQSNSPASNRLLWVGGGIALLLATGGMVYALWLRQPDRSQPDLQLNPPIATPSPTPVPAPAVTPRANPTAAPSPAPAPRFSPEPEPSPAPISAPAPAPEPIPLPEPDPIPAPAPAPVESYVPPVSEPVYEPEPYEPESAYEPEPYYEPEPAPAPAPDPAPAPAPAPDVPYIEVPDF